MRKKRAAAQKTALFGILCAQAIALSFLEGLLPPLLPVQGMKIGLSNIVTMYCVYALGASYGLAVTLFKAVFALLTRGFTAFLLSLSGGLLSLLAMIVLFRLKPNRFGFIGIGVICALMHNTGQLLVCALLTGKTIFALTPALIILGVLTGIITGVTLKYTLPLLQKQRELILNKKQVDNNYRKRG